MNKRDGAMRRLFCMDSNPPAGPVGHLRKGLGCGRIFRMGFRNVDEASFDELQFFFSRLQIFFGDVLRIEQNDLVSTGLLSFVQGAVRKIDTVVHVSAIFLRRRSATRLAPPRGVSGNSARNSSPPQREIMSCLRRLFFIISAMVLKTISPQACP